MHTYIQVIYDIDTCFITVSFRCHVVYWSIVIIRHGFSGALHWACSHFWMMFHCSTIFQMNFLLSRVLSIQQNLADLAYIYIPLEHPSFFFQKTGIFRLNSWEFSRGSPDCPVRRMNSDRWVLTRNPAPCSHPDSSGAKRGRNAEKFMNSWDISWGNA